MTIKKNDVVQFTEDHKWCGCLGIVSEVKSVTSGHRYMIGAPIPNNQGKAQTAFIFDNGDNIERIGIAALVLKEDKTNE